jgi:ligand-binding sensor domain-containing protein
VEDKNKNIWIGSRGGLDRYDFRQKKILTINYFLKSQMIFH